MASSSPRHIGLIMDGNGRWATERGWPRIQGHRAGARTVRRITTWCAQNDIQTLTLFAFSKENWSRPQREIDLLMKLLVRYTKKERPTMIRDGIRFRTIGCLSDLPPFVQDELQKTEELTSSGNRMCLQLALSYSGRSEILRASQRILEAYKKQKLQESELTEKTFEDFLDTSGQPPLDLMIRTSGEQRLSNFLLWQAAYTEFVFVDYYWPDFDEAQMERAISIYQQRKRRFGGLHSDAVKTLKQSKH